MNGFAIRSCNSGAELKSETDINDWKLIGTDDPIAFSCYGKSNGCWADNQPDQLEETALEIKSDGKWNNIKTNKKFPLLCQKEVTRVHGPPRDDFVCGSLFKADCAYPAPYCKDNHLCSSSASGTNSNDFSSTNVESGIIGCHLKVDPTINFHVISFLGWTNIAENRSDVAGWSEEKGFLPGIGTALSDELKKEDGLRICNWPAYINATDGESIHFSAVFNRHRSPDITNAYCNGDYVAKETVTSPIVKCLLHIPADSEAETTYTDFYTRTSDLPAILDRLEYRYFVKQATRTAKYLTLERFGLDYAARDDPAFTAANIQYCENLCLHETNCAGFTTEAQTQSLCWPLDIGKTKFQLIDILPLSDTVIEKSKTMEIKLCGDTDECVLIKDSQIDNDKVKQCPANSHCENTIGSYDCKCDDGYEKAGTGTFDVCNNINECDTTNSKNNACDDNISVCQDNDGSYTCECNEGYKRDPSNDKGCIDIDECNEQKPNSDFYECHPNAMCVNTIGSYKCSCNLGFRGDESEEPPNNCQDYDECKAKRKVWSMKNAYCPIGEFVTFQEVKQKCLDMHKVALTVRTPEQRDAYFETV